MELEKALEIANRMVRFLSPVCDKIKIAGSIRRKKPDVKDIELVVSAKKFEYPDGDLFEPKTILKVIPEFTQRVNNLGKILKGNSGGRYMQIELDAGIKLDLFIPEEGDFFRQYVIRTGSSDYSHKVIANGWRKIGWVGSNVGLRREVDCDKKIASADGKVSWICNDPHAELPPVWKSEEEFFEWLQVPYLEPENRVVV